MTDPIKDKSVSDSTHPKDELSQMLERKLYTEKPFNPNEVFEIRLPEGGLDRRLVKANDNNMVMVQGHYKFFEIENLLRTMCHDMFEPIRLRMIQEGEPGKQALAVANKNTLELSKHKSKISDLEGKVKHLQQLESRLSNTETNLEGKILRNANRTDGLGI